MNANKIIGTNLMGLRKLNGLTQKQVAIAVGVPRSTYIKYERGTLEMPYDVMDRVGDLLGCETSRLFEDTPVSQSDLIIPACNLKGCAPEDYKEIIRFKSLIKTSLQLDRIQQECN